MFALIHKHYGPSAWQQVP